MGRHGEQEQRGDGLRASRRWDVRVRCEGGPSFTIKGFEEKTPYEAMVAFFHEGEGGFTGNEEFDYPAMGCSRFYVSVMPSSAVAEGLEGRLGSVGPCG